MKLCLFTAPNIVLGEMDKINYGIYGKNVEFMRRQQVNIVDKFENKMYNNLLLK